MPEWTTGDVITETRMRATTALRQTHVGLVMQTHPDFADRRSKIQIQRLHEAVFHDGFRRIFTEAQFPVTIDIAASAGAGALDQGSEEASTWYEVYLARKSSDGTLAGFLHKANRLLTASHATSNTTQALGSASTNTRVGQSFTIAATGNLRVLLLQASVNGIPGGGNVQFWATIEADNAGSPSGTPLATSQKWYAVDVSATERTIPFTFYGTQAVQLSSATTYWVVVHHDYGVNGSNHLLLGANSLNAFPGGELKIYNGSSWSSVASHDLAFAVITETDDAAIALPTGGYDQMCQLGYAYNDASSHFQSFQTIGSLTHNRFTETAVSAKLIAVVDTTNIGNVVYDSAGQVPPVALCYVNGMATNQASSGAQLTLAGLDMGINRSGAHAFARTHVKINNDGDENQHWADVPFQWGMAQMYRNAVNNQQFYPFAWRLR